MVKITKNDNQFDYIHETERYYLQNYPIRIEAKTCLQGRMLRAFALFGAQILLSAVLGGSAYFVNKCMMPLHRSVYSAAAQIAIYAVSVYLLSALRQGRRAWHLRCMSGREPSFLQVYYWLRHARSVRCRFLSIRVALRKGGWIILLQLPAAALIAAWVLQRQHTVMTATSEAIVIGGAVLCCLIGAAFSAVINRQYDVAMLLQAIEPSIASGEAIRSSRRCMQHHCVRMLCFRLSFVPWFICCLLILPTFFVAPYYEQCCICALQRIVSGQKGKIR